MGSFIIELLNHLEDKNHQSLTIDYPGDGEHCKPSGTSWGYPIFIKQSLLDFNCRFCDIPGKITSLKIAFLIARSTL